MYTDDQQFLKWREADLDGSLESDDELPDDLLDDDIATDSNPQN